MSSAKSSVLVAVLGMHRSGTSAIAKALEVVGVSLGSRLMPGKEDNEKGFWEDLDVVALNDRALAHLGRNWSSLTPVSQSETDRLRKAGFIDEAADLLRRRLGEDPRYGFKDPRCARLGAMWREAMSVQPGTSVAVITLRHPSSVADSLLKRDQLGPERSHLLWLDYTLSALMASRDLPRLVMDYDLLMQDPHGEIARLGQLVAQQPDPRSLNEFSGNFLDERLRHSKHAEQDLRGGGELMDLVQDVYAGLRKHAQQSISVEVQPLQEQAQRWCKALNRWRLVLAAADTPNTVELREGRRAVERAAAAEVQRDALQRALDEVQVLARERAEALDRTDAALQEVQVLARERAEALDRTDAALQVVHALALERAEDIRQREERIEQLQQAFESVQRLAWERAGNIDELLQRLSVADAELAQLREEEARLHRLYLEVTRSRSWRWTAPFRKLAESLSREAQPLQ